MMTTTTMMLRRGGDLNLNSSVQAYGDSIKEGLKQAMLQHEVIFRNQVRRFLLSFSGKKRKRLFGIS